MGSVEVAEFLGVTRPRVDALRKTALWRRHVPNIQRLRMGPVYLAEEIRAFHAAWDRRPGRPRKGPLSE